MIYHSLTCPIPSRFPLAVAHDAVKGTFVCGDADAFDRFKTEIEAHFGEQRDNLRRRRRAVIDRIAEDGLRGWRASRRDPNLSKSSSTTVN